MTLIEVLIALLVLSIGLVGIAVLHLSSLQNAHSSYYSSIASSIALDFEEQLWIAVGDQGAGPCLGSVAVTELANDLQNFWSGGVDDLPSGVAMSIPGLVVSAGPVAPGPSEYSWTQVPIVLSWLDQRFTDSAEANEQFSYSARVVCYDPDDGDDEEDD